MTNFTREDCFEFKHTIHLNSLLKIAEFSKSMALIHPLHYILLLTQRMLEAFSLQC